MELCQGRGSWGLWKGSAPEGGGDGLKVQGAFSQLSQKYGSILGCPMWSLELDLVIPMGSFQLRVFYDSPSSALPISSETLVTTTPQESLW